MNYICKLPSPIGVLTLASDGINITGLWCEGQKYFAATLEEAAEETALPVFSAAAEWLSCYFSGKEPSTVLPLAPKGSVFRQAVWKILCGIPFGQVITYGEIANMLEQQTRTRASAQAVGGAVGHNPISIIIPCHRVVGTGGSLTGYAGGIRNKLKLLRLENAPVENLFMPKSSTAP